MADIFTDSLTHAGAENPEKAENFTEMAIEKHSTRKT